MPTKTYRAGAFVSSAQRLDIDVTLASEEPSSLADYLPADLIALDFGRPEKGAEQAVRFARKHPIDAVVAVDDGATLAAAAIGEALAVPHNNYRSVYATRNKRVMRERLAAAGVPVPDFRAIAVDDDARAVAATIDYPVVVKPLMMSASRGVIRADDPGAFVDAVDHVTTLVRDDAGSDDDARCHILVESYVPGWEVAVEGMLAGGRLHVFAIFDKPDPLEGPFFPETIYTTPSRLPVDVQRRVVATAQDATRALGLDHGPIHAELRGDGERLWVIEVAARSIGGYCSRVLRFEGGHSLEEVIIRQALDPAIPPPPREAEAAGVFMMQAPRAGVFEGARGLEAARAIDGVTEVIVSAHPGQSLTPLPDGFLYVGFIFAHAESPERVEAVLREAGDVLELAIKP